MAQRGLFMIIMSVCRSICPQGFQGMPGHPGPVGEKGPSGPVGPTVRQEGHVASIRYARLIESK